jgi:hypothetical protein
MTTCTELHKIVSAFQALSKRASFTVASFASYHLAVGAPSLTQSLCSMALALCHSLLGRASRARSHFLSSLK